MSNEISSTDLILHSYDASPFTQKALRMLGVKNLEWFWVETPMILPKPDLTVLTGGYRGTPVLQIGADVYVDNSCIALELEKRFPEPSLFPNSNRGMQQALVKWSDSFFRAGLYMIIELQSRDWPEEFRADRQALFTDIDFDTLDSELDYARSQLRAHAALINEQLQDGRKFLVGDKPSLADIHAFSVPWFSRAGMAEVNDLLADLAFLPAWEERVAAIGEGTRTPVEAGQAHAVAKTAAPLPAPAIGAIESRFFSTGQRVTIEPDDARRGGVSGELVYADTREIALRHENDTVGEVVVHFPRIGYRATPA